MTQEFIETEACNHYNPGAAILSLGNIGCMMACDFCHNWQTSQVKHVQKKDIHHYTPEQVVETALAKGIGMLSWTYNDPVVWQEFVVDTARLARKHGLKNLYKSAFYIGPEAIDELLEVMDIFSLSLKSMDPVFYSQITKGRLEPVLAGIKQVYAHGGAHMELSNLLITGRNDNMEEVDRICSWMLTNLDENVPLHLVRFHPDFKYTDVERTSIPFLFKARERALQLGMKHVYLGNVYEEGDGLITRCTSCSHVLVNRFGLSVNTDGLDTQGNCKKCGTPSSVKLVPMKENQLTDLPDTLPSQIGKFTWHGDINACHVEIHNPSDQEHMIYVEMMDSMGRKKIQALRILANEKWRMIASKSHKEEKGVKVYFDNPLNLHFFEVLDRAHFPTVEFEATP